MLNFGSHIVKKEKKEMPNCWKCKFFRITWDKNFRYGCESMGFRSKVLPSLEVFKSDGRHCLSFKTKSSDFGLDGSGAENVTG